MLILQRKEILHCFSKSRSQENAVPPFNGKSSTRLRVSYVIKSGENGQLSEALPTIPGHAVICMPMSRKIILIQFFKSQKRPPAKKMTLKLEHTPKQPVCLE